VISLDNSTVRPAEMPVVVEVARRAGLILLISEAGLDAATKLQIASAAGSAFFDLAAPSLASNDQDILQRVLAIADSLRIVSSPRSSEKVN
jgi:hypothetical protein